MSNKISNIIKYLSGVILFFISKFIIRNKSGNEILFCLHKLGDSVLTFPVVELLASKNKDIIIVCFKDSEALFKSLFPELKLFIVENHHIINKRIFSFSAIMKLRRLKPYISYDITGSVLTASIIAFSGAKEVIGLNERFFKRLYTVYNPIRKTPHLINRYLDAIEIEKSTTNYKVEYPASYEITSSILIHPFAGWNAKEWAMKKFIALYKELQINYNVKFIGPSNSLRTDKDVLENNISYIETNNINELIKELQNSSLIISNDSGPVHLAAYLGKPTFSLYGPTNPEFSVPIGKHHKYIQNKVPCSPKEGMQYCEKDAGRNGCNEFICMNNLEITDVYSEIKNFIISLGIIKK